MGNREPRSGNALEELDGRGICKVDCVVNQTNEIVVPGIDNCRGLDGDGTCIVEAIACRKRRHSAGIDLESAGVARRRHAPKGDIDIGKGIDGPNGRSRPGVSRFAGQLNVTRGWFDRVRPVRRNIIGIDRDRRTVLRVRRSGREPGQRCRDQEQRKAETGEATEHEKSSLLMPTSRNLTRFLPAITLTTGGVVTR
jgi:hypothetical protein